MLRPTASSFLELCQVFIECRESGSRVYTLCVGGIDEEASGEETVHWRRMIRFIVFPGDDDFSDIHDIPLDIVDTVVSMMALLPDEEDLRRCNGEGLYGPGGLVNADQCAEFIVENLKRPGIRNWITVHSWSTKIDGTPAPRLVTAHAKLVSIMMAGAAIFAFRYDGQSDDWMRYIWLTVYRDADIPSMFTPEEWHALGWGGISETLMPLKFAREIKFMNRYVRAYLHTVCSGITGSDKCAIVSLDGSFINDNIDTTGHNDTVS